MKECRVKDFLRKSHVTFSCINHPLTFTAQRTAHAAHIPGQELAKPVIIKVKGQLVMVVLSANQKLNLRMLKNIYKTEDVELAREMDFISAFPDCEVGAMPPFGNLYGLEEIISRDLAKDEDIVFNAGTHTELIKMKYNDFEKLVSPRVLDFKIKLR